MLHRQRGESQWFTTRWLFVDRGDAEVRPQQLLVKCRAALGRFEVERSDVMLDYLLLLWIVGASRVHLVLANQDGWHERLDIGSLLMLLS